MKPARVVAGRDIKPSNVVFERDVELTWRDEIDPDRARRVASILSRIMDKATNPDESGKP